MCAWEGKQVKQEDGNYRTDLVWVPCNEPGGCGATK